MKHVAKAESAEHVNAESCVVYEYGDNGVSDAARIELNGRYPVDGKAMNTRSRAVVYILQGTGSLVVNGKPQELRESDVVFIEAGEPYFFEGNNLRMFMSCTPGWSIDQYREVE